MEKEKSLDELKEALAKKQGERILRCKEKIEKILMEENCFLEAGVIITSKGINFNISISPKEV